MSVVTTRHSEIAEYWAGKSITRSGDIIKGTDSDAVMVIVDAGEPSCWACDRPIVGSAEESEDSTFERIWDNKYVKSKFNRCHITPAALGGKDEPSNLFLMCAHCHNEAPDTSNPKTFFRWVYDKRKTNGWGVPTIDEINRLLSEECSRRGLSSVETLFQHLPEEKQKAITDALTKDELTRRLRTRVGSHGSVVKTNSLVAGIVDVLLKEYLKSIEIA